MSSKNIGLFLSIFLSLTFIIIYLGSPLKNKRWKIVFDEEKIKFRENFLAEKLTAQNDMPNIIIIMADDLGKHELSLYGGNYVNTANIDAIGKNGVVFDEGYISSPICAPSRAGMMTGRYQQRFGFEINIHERYPKNRLEYYGAKLFVSNDPFIVAKQNPPVFPDFEEMHKQGLPPTEIILPELLKKQGYNTGMFGKWHLGYNLSALPIKRGFDYHYGFLEAFSLYAPVDDPNIVNEKHADFTDKHIWKKARSGNCAIQRNGTIVEEKTYLTYKIAEEANSWMQENHKNGPFFMYIPFSAPHTPFQALKRHYDIYAHIKDRNKRVYYAMIHALDEAVGQITSKVKELGLSENTIIIFLSDNGGATYTHAADNSPLKGGKFSNFEGGINVPFLMSWPAKIKSGIAYKHPVSALDIFATLAAVTNSKLPEDRVFDGVNLIPYVRGEFPDQKPHNALYWRSMHHKAIRKGPWKLIRDDLGNSTALYNLDADKAELKNLADECPETVKMLFKEFEIWEKGLIKPNWPRVLDYKIVDGAAEYYFPL
jgi:arylsulfatase A-like enzyme